MLAKKYRLNKTKDIEKILGKGQILFSPFLNLKYLSYAAGTPAPNSHFCIIISTKISKKAVVRNRAKRQISAVLEKILPNLKKPLDAVVLTKPAITVADFSQIEAEIKQLLAKAGAL